MTPIFSVSWERASVKSEGGRRDREWGAGTEMACPGKQRSEVMKHTYRLLDRLNGPFEVGDPESKTLANAQNN